MCRKSLLTGRTNNSVRLCLTGVMPRLHLVGESGWCLRRPFLVDLAKDVDGVSMAVSTAPTFFGVSLSGFWEADICLLRNKRMYPLLQPNRQASPQYW